MKTNGLEVVEEVGAAGVAVEELPILSLNWKLLWGACWSGGGMTFFSSSSFSFYSLILEAKDLLSFSKPVEIGALSAETNSSLLLEEGVLRLSLTKELFFDKTFSSNETSGFAGGISSFFFYSPSIGF